jgi:hypothetical protein
MDSTRPQNMISHTTKLLLLKLVSVEHARLKQEVDLRGGHLAKELSDVGMALIEVKRLEAVY